MRTPWKAPAPAGTWGKQPATPSWQSVGHPLRHRPPQRQRHQHTGRNIVTSANDIASEVLPGVVASSECRGHMAKQSTLSLPAVEAKYQSNCSLLSKSMSYEHQPAPPSPPLSTLCQATATTLIHWQFEIWQSTIVFGLLVQCPEAIMPNHNYQHISWRQSCNNPFWGEEGDNLLRPGGFEAIIILQSSVACNYWQHNTTVLFAGSCLHQCGSI